MVRARLLTEKAVQGALFSGPSGALFLFLDVVFPILSHLLCEVGVIACHTQFDFFQIPRMVEKGGFLFFARNTLTSEGRGRHGWNVEPVLFRHGQSLTENRAKLSRCSVREVAQKFPHESKGVGSINLVWPRMLLRLHSIVFNSNITTAVGVNDVFHIVSSEQMGMGVLIFTVG